MIPLRVIGIDPGSRSTGIAVYNCGKYEAHDLVERPKTFQWDSRHFWAEHLEERIDALLFKPEFERGTSILAVEDIGAFSFRDGKPVSSKHVIETAFLVGWIMAAYKPQFSVIPVPPAGHGSSHRQDYPPELIGPQEKNMTGKLRHCRSAYDVARTAYTTHQTLKRQP